VRGRDIKKGMRNVTTRRTHIKLAGGTKNEKKSQRSRSVNQQYFVESGGGESGDWGLFPHLGSLRDVVRQEGSWDHGDTRQTISTFNGEKIIKMLGDRRRKIILNQSTLFWRGEESRSTHQLGVIAKSSLLD